MYYRTIPDNNTLDEIQELIEDEELGASQFVECKAAPLKSGNGALKNTNLIKFQELEPSQIPKSPKLSLEASDDLESLKWQGHMYVEQQLRTVYLYR
jgi:hypothetical protein